MALHLAAHLSLRHSGAALLVQYGFGGQHAHQLLSSSSSARLHARHRVHLRQPRRLSPIWHFRPMSWGNFADLASFPFRAPDGRFSHHQRQNWRHPRFPADRCSSHHRLARFGNHSRRYHHRLCRASSIQGVHCGYSEASTQMAIPMETRSCFHFTGRPIRARSGGAFPRAHWSPRHHGISQMRYWQVRSGDTFLPFWLPCAVPGTRYSTSLSCASSRFYTFFACFHPCQRRIHDPRGHRGVIEGRGGRRRP